MSSWTRIPAKKPPTPVAAFVPLQSSPAVSELNQTEVVGWPHPYKRAAQNLIVEPAPMSTVQQSKWQPLAASQTQQQQAVREFTDPLQQRKTAKNPNQRPEIKPLKLEALKVNQLPPATEPQVTVIIALHEGIEFLEDAILSVKRQTYTEWVGLLSLTDLTEAQTYSVKVLVNNAGLNNRFTLIQSAYSSKPQALDASAKLATTPFVAFLNPRDIWLPKKLELQLQAAAAMNLDIVGTLYREIGESNKAVNLPVGNLTRNDFAKSNPLIYSSVMMKRPMANFTEEFTSYDYDCWTRNLINNAKLYNIDVSLVFHRITRSSLFNPVNTKPEQVRQKYLDV